MCWLLRSPLSLGSQLCRKKKLPIFLAIFDFSELTHYIRVFVIPQLYTQQSVGFFINSISLTYVLPATEMKFYPDPICVRLFWWLFVLCWHSPFLVLLVFTLYWWSELEQQTSRWQESSVLASIHSLRVAIIMHYVHYVLASIQSRFCVRTSHTDYFVLASMLILKEGRKELKIRWLFHISQNLFLSMVTLGFVASVPLCLIIPPFFSWRNLVLLPHQERHLSHAIHLCLKRDKGILSGISMKKTTPHFP